MMARTFVRRSHSRRVLSGAATGVMLALLTACGGVKVQPKPNLVDGSTGVPLAPDEPAVRHPTAQGPDGTVLPVLHTIKKETGLVIEDLKMGNGPDCLPTSLVTVRYHGTLADGTVFDTTRGESPREYQLAKLVRGWREGLPGMKVGGVRRLTIPAGLAYGEAGNARQHIPPDSEIFFSIELVDVKLLGEGSEARP